MNPRSAFALICAGTLLLTGCASAPDAHFYTLLGNSGVPYGSDNATSSGASIAIGSVTLPETVDRAELVIRTGANRVMVMDSQRWAESLKSAIPRVIADDVSKLLGGAMVSVQSDNASRDAKYLVSIDITRFDSTLNEAATIEAFWSVRLAAGGPTKSGKSAFRIPVHGGGFDELVAAHALALAGLSGEIAVKITAMEMAAD
jgi:hypothetical protein